MNAVRADQLGRDPFDVAPEEPEPAVCECRLDFDEWVLIDTWKPIEHLEDGCNILAYVDAGEQSFCIIDIRGARRVKGGRLPFGGDSQTKGVKGDIMIVSADFTPNPDGSLPRRGHVEDRPEEWTRIGTNWHNSRFDYHESVQPEHFAVGLPEHDSQWICIRNREHYGETVLTAIDDAVFDSAKARVGGY